MPKFSQLSERFQRLKSYWEDLGSSSSRSASSRANIGGSTNRLVGGSVRKYSNPIADRPFPTSASTDCLSGQYGDSQTAVPVRAVGIRASGRGTVKQGIRKRFEAFEELSSNGLDSRKNSLSEETKAERAELFLRYQAEKLQDRSKYKSVFDDRVGPEFDDPATLSGAGALKISEDEDEEASSSDSSSSTSTSSDSSPKPGEAAAAAKTQQRGKSSNRKASGHQRRNKTADRTDGELAGRLTGSGPGRTMWCNMPEVREAGLLRVLTKEEVKLQEAQFEIITSEASYYKNLLVLIDVFYNSELFDHTLPNAFVNALDKHHLFSNIVDIFECSTTFLKNLEEKWKQDPKMDWVGQVILDNLATLEKAYKVYCRNFFYQTKTLQKLCERPDFVAQLAELERHPSCRRITMQSYLEMPMKRVMSLQLLMDAVMRRMQPTAAAYSVGILALGQLLTLARECDQESRMMSEKEQLLKLQNQLSFNKVKKVGCWGGGRHLIKEGQLRVLSATPNTQGFITKLSLKKNYLQLHAFSDLLIVSKAKSDQEFHVLKHCPRAYVDAECFPPNFANASAAAAAMAALQGTSAGPQKQTLRLRLVDTSDGTPEVTLMFELRSREEAERWMRIFSPRDELGDPVYEPDDCPQAEAVRAYRPQQKDDLELRPGDIVNVYKKTEDGWFLGSRLTQLGFRGWFPGSHVREIENEHYKAKLRKVSFRRKSAIAAYARHKP